MLQNFCFKHMQGLVTTYLSSKNFDLTYEVKIFSVTSPCALNGAGNC